MKLCFLLVAIATNLVAAFPGESGQEYVGEWAVWVLGGEAVAGQVADENGFKFDRRIGKLEDHYLFSRENHQRSKRAASEVDQALLQDERVLWAEQQHLRNHERRGSEVVKPDATGDNHSLYFNDPLYPKQWYLYNDGQNGGTSGMDMNVMPVWKLGYTGKGIRVSVIDDGVDGTHLDLADNFDINASFDFNNRSSGNHDRDPHPDDSEAKGSENSHGTRCAGEIAAVGNNSICGVGVAYEASIGGMRILDGPVTDALEAEALLYHNDYIDILSCCWGPPDKGKDFVLPHTLTTQALIQGVEEGRNGKGSIFVWASGNGGSVDDDCNADGYVSRPETVSIGTVNDEGLNVYFTEECSSTMAVTASGGPSKSPFSNTDARRQVYGLNLVITTDLHGECTSSFVGTSSAAPLASGVFALILQANPNLTWRDLQHIISRGCFIPNPNEDGWHINGAGFHLNHKFGFGLLDAGKMVELALKWEPVGERQECVLDDIDPELVVEQGSTSRARVTVTGCNDITRLEHIIAHLTLEAPRRGDISIKLFSPDGTPSELLSTRRYDSSEEGLDRWPFMSVHHWGESPRGEWTLEITYNPSPKDMDEEPPPVLPREKRIAKITGWGFTFYGTRGDDEEGKQTDAPPDGRVFESKAGQYDSGTILKVYNAEQKADEEIHLSIDQMAENAPMPPNFENNKNENGDEINTNLFNSEEPIQTRSEVFEDLDEKREEGNLAEYLRGLDPDTLSALYDQVERELEDQERTAHEEQLLAEARNLAAVLEQKRVPPGPRETYRESLSLRRKALQERALALRKLLREHKK